MGISVAAMLKDCPEGTPLYSPLCGECKLVNVDCDGTRDDQLVIQVKDHCGNHIFFTDEGKYLNGGDVVLFPDDYCEVSRWKHFIGKQMCEDDNGGEDSIDAVIGRIRQRVWELYIDLDMTVSDAYLKQRLDYIGKVTMLFHEETEKLKQACQRQKRTDGHVE